MIVLHSYYTAILLKFIIKLTSYCHYPYQKGRCTNGGILYQRVTLLDELVRYSSQKYDAYINWKNKLWDDLDKTNTRSFS